MNSVSQAASPMASEPHCSYSVTVGTPLSHNLLQGPVCGGWAMGEESGEETDPDMPQLVPVPADLQKKPCSGHLPSQQVKADDTQPCTGRIRNLKRRKAFRLDHETLAQKLHRRSVPSTVLIPTL